MWRNVLTSLIYMWLKQVYLFWWCCLLFFNFNWRLITLQYCSVFCHTLAWISHGYTSWTAIPPPFPAHPSGSSQCTIPEHPVSCIKPWLAICFTSDYIHVSMLFSQIIPPSPCPTESKRLFFTSVSLLLSHIEGHRYHLSICHIYALVYCFIFWCSMTPRLPWWLRGKESTCQCRRCRRPRLTPGSRRSPGEGNGNPLQYSCLGNPMDRGAWWAIVYEITRVGHNLATNHHHLWFHMFNKRYNLLFTPTNPTELQLDKSEIAVGICHCHQYHSKAFFDITAFFHSRTITR